MFRDWGTNIFESKMRPVKNRIRHTRTTGPQPWDTWWELTTKNTQAFQRSDYSQSLAGRTASVSSTSTTESCCCTFACCRTASSFATSGRFFGRDPMSYSASEGMSIANMRYCSNSLVDLFQCIPSNEVFKICSWIRLSLCVRGFADIFRVGPDAPDGPQKT
jgi:hypothetical protein